MRGRRFTSRPTRMFPVGDSGGPSDRRSPSPTRRPKRSGSPTSPLSPTAGRTGGSELGEHTCELHTVRAARERVEVALDDLSGSILKAFDDVEEFLERSKLAGLLELHQFPETGEQSANGQPVYTSPRWSCDPSDYGNGSEAKEATVQEHVSNIERPRKSVDSLASLEGLVPMKGMNSMTSMDGGQFTVEAEGLSADWPRSLQPRWQNAAEEGSFKDHNSGREFKSIGLGKFDITSTNGLTQLLQNGAGAEQVGGLGRSRFYVIHPNSTGRMIYDMLSFAFLVFDIITIPWMLAWEVPLEGTFLNIAWATSIFWTQDIVISFMTAYHSNGEVICDPAAIAKNYARSWLLPDISVVSCDWVTLVASNNPGLRVLRFAKLGRLLRLVGMFRMLRFARVLEDLMEANLSDFGKLMVRIARMIVTTCIYTHMMCCTWYFIGRAAPSDTGLHWIEYEISLGDGTVDFSEQDWGYQYVTSLHWAVSQITLGAMEIICVSSAERLWGICCLLGGLLFSSTLVSTLSAVMLEAQMDKREMHLKRQQMKRYLRENGVERRIAVQVDKQLQERLLIKDKLKEDDVKGLALLSAGLRAELRLHVTEHVFQSHSLFKLWMNIDLPFVQRFCMHCIKFHFHRSDDELFHAGKEAEGVYFLVSGGFDYSQDPQTSAVLSPTTTEVPERTWLAEAAMSSQWTHVGVATATKYSEVAELQLDCMEELMKGSTATVLLTHDYCRSFHRRLRSARPPSSNWPNDLEVPLTDWADVVLAMDKGSQIVIGMDAIRQTALGFKWKKAAAGLDNLSNEVRAGKSTVLLNQEGEIQRTVSLVAIAIMNHEEDKTLIQIWKREGSAMVQACQLPGGKQDRGELILDTMERLLASKLSPVCGHTDLIQTSREVQWKESKEFGIRTKYLKNIVRLKLRGLEGYSKLDDLKIATEEHLSSLDEDRAVTVDRPPEDWRIRGRSNTIHSGGSILSEHRFSSKEAQEALDNFKSRDVFRIKDSKGGEALYCWLSDSEFAQMDFPVGQEVLPLWLADLNRRSQAAGEAALL